MLPDTLLGTGKVPGKPVFFLTLRNGCSTVSIRVMLATDGGMVQYGMSP